MPKRHTQHPSQKLRALSRKALLRASRDLWIAFLLASAALFAVGWYSHIRIVWPISLLGLAAAYKLTTPPIIVDRVLRHSGLIALFLAVPLFVTAAHGTRSFAWPTLFVCLGALPLIRGWWIGFDDQPHEVSALEGAGLHQAPAYEKFSSSVECQLLTSKLVRWPARYILRAIHEVRQEEGYLHHTLKREIIIPYIDPQFRRNPKAKDTEPVCLYVPLLRSRRNSLVDNLETDSDLGRVPVLLARDARVLTLLLISKLSRALYLRYGEEPPAELERALAGLGGKIVAGDEEAATSVKRESDTTLPLFKQLPLPNALSGEEKQNRKEEEEKAVWKRERASIAGLWEAALQSRLVFGQVLAPMGATVSITASYTAPLTQPVTGTRGEQTASKHRQPSGKGQNLVPWSKDHLRLIFGMRSPRLRVPLHYVHEPASYHLRLRVPEDQYVYDTRVDPPEARSEAQLLNGEEPAAYLVAHADPDTRAVGFAHVYVRPFETTGRRVAHLDCNFDIRERPPGILAIVALVAFAQLVLVAFVAGFYQHFFEGAGRDRGASDVAPLLLALPGVVSAWLTHQVTPARMQRTTLSAILGIGFNSALAIASTVLAVLARSGYDWQSATVGGLIVAHPAWLLIAAVAAWNAGNLLLRWWNNTWRFITKVRRPGTLQEYFVEEPRSI